MSSSYTWIICFVSFVFLKFLNADMFVMPQGHTPCMKTFGAHVPPECNKHGFLPFDKLSNLCYRKESNINPIVSPRYVTWILSWCSFIFLTFRFDNFTKIYTGTDDSNNIFLVYETSFHADSNLYIRILEFHFCKIISGIRYKSKRMWDSAQGVPNIPRKH